MGLGSGAQPPPHIDTNARCLLYLYRCSAPTVTVYRMIWDVQGREGVSGQYLPIAQRFNTARSLILSQVSL